MSLEAAKLLLRSKVECVCGWMDVELCGEEIRGGVQYDACLVV